MVVTDGCNIVHFKGLFVYKNVILKTKVYKYVPTSMLCVIIVALRQKSGLRDKRMK